MGPLALGTVGAAMTTWGPSKKPPQNRARTGGVPASRTSKTTAASRGGVRDATPPSTSRNRRTRAQSDLRGAVEGREHEFVGVGLIGGGVLLGLGIYWNLAGPVGRGIEKLFGWITGVGRYALPLVLIAVGIALVHKGRSSNPLRLVLGWGLMALSALGVVHLVRGPDKISAGFDELGTAGGWLGALVAEPLRAMLASGGCSGRAPGGVRRRAVARDQHITADDGDADRSRGGVGRHDRSDARHARRSPTSRR